MRRAVSRSLPRSRARSLRSRRKRRRPRRKSSASTRSSSRRRSASSRCRTCRSRCPAFSGEMLKEGRMGDIRGIVDFTPGFSGKTEDGFTDALAMRGIATNDFGIGGDPSVAMFDGRHLGGPHRRRRSPRSTTSSAPRSSRARRARSSAGTRSPAQSASSPTSRENEFDASAELTARRLRHDRGHGDGQRPDQRRSGHARGRLPSRERSGFLENLAGGDELGFHEVERGPRRRCATPATSVDATLIVSYEDREQDPSVYWVPAAGWTRGGEHRPRRRRHRRVRRLRSARRSSSGRCRATTR